jgi:MarR family transcriptional regulator, organic hydroperoxide resistance regulator
MLSNAAPRSGGGQRLDPEKSLGYQVRRCHRRFDRLLAASLAPHGLKIGFWYYLRVLWIKDGVTQRHLSEMTNVTENTTATLIDGMIKDGLVTRERNPADRREMCVSLTTKGRRLEGELLSYAIGINEAATRGIKARDLEVCARVLKQMSLNLQAEFAKAGTAAES